jgi:NDP-sugar pyrophosphorylase family protein
VYRGPHTEAGPGTLGEGAIVLAGAVVEDGAHVERSIVWPGEIVPSGTYLSNCVWAFGRSLQ